MVKFNFISTLLFFVLFFQSGNLSGQQTIGQNSDSLNYVSYPLFFELLEKRDSVHIFFKEEWFSKKKINRIFAELPIEEALLHVRRLNNFSYTILDDRSYIFLPYQTIMEGKATNNASETTVIGNSNELGKYTRATVAGKIFDGKTGEPLPGATIMVEKLKITKNTDASGNYSLILPVGEHIIKLTYVGYEDNAKEVRVFSSGAANFELFEKSIKINEVVISSDRAEFNISKTQMSVLLMNAKTIKELPVSLGEIDIIRSMSLLPGVQNTGEFGTGFNVRGGSADQNLMLVEDVPLFNSSHLFGLTSALNGDDVQNVTLLKGGIPARYGERASSIMDIRLGVENTGKFKVKGGIGLLNSRLSLSLPMFNKKANLLLGARSSYSNWLLHKMPDYNLKNSSASFYDFDLLYTLNLNAFNKFTVFGYYSKDYFNFNQNIHYAYSNLMGSIKWTHLYSRKFSSSILTGLSQYKYTVNESDTLHSTASYQINIHAKYNNLKLNFAWLPNDNHSFDFGFNGILYRLSPGEELPYGIGSDIKPRKVQTEKGLELAVYMGDNFNITSKLNAELGLRFVHYLSLGPGSILTFLPGYPKSLQTVSDTVFYNTDQVIAQYSGFEPRVAFRYKIDNLSSLKWSYSRIDQFINLLSTTTVMAPSDSWKLSTVGLKPLFSDQFSIGYFRNFANNTYETSIEVYYKLLQNIIEYKNGTQILLNEHIEADLIHAKGKNYGTEVYIKKNRGLLTGWLSYTYSRSFIRTTGATVYEQINNNCYYPSNYDRPHNLELITNFHISKRWRFSGTFTYNTGKPVTLPELTFPYSGNQFFYYNNPGVFIGSQLVYYSDRNKYRLPDYHRLDLSITFDENLSLKKMWKGSWTLSVVNVYARKNVYSVYYAKKDATGAANSGEIALYMMYIIGVPLPTLTYNFTF